MKAIKYHKGLVYPLNRENVDTDQIIPKQFLKAIERTGFGKYLFYHWRFDDNGQQIKGFTLNDEMYKGVSIILAGKNFGCGSSREHAAWALLDYGFRVVIAPSFADIFYNNALKNGILPIQLDEGTIKGWMESAESRPFTLAVDLEAQTIEDGTRVIPFDIPQYHKEKLVNGWDDIDLTLLHSDKIKAYEMS